MLSEFAHKDPSFDKPLKLPVVWDELEKDQVGLSVLPEWMIRRVPGSRPDALPPMPSGYNWTIAQCVRTVRAHAERIAKSTVVQGLLVREWDLQCHELEILGRSCTLQLYVTQLLILILKD